jgi:uncharacterized protein (DUF885 family)
MSGTLMTRVLTAVAFVALTACATTSAAPDEAAADARFRQIYETEWAWRQRSEPEEDSDTPDEEKALRTWGKVDPATQAERLSYMKDVIRQLDVLDPKSLSPEAKINLAVYRDQIDVRMARIEFREHEKPLNADTTFWTRVASAAPKGFRTETEARAWIARMGDTPRYFADQIANMKLGMARSFTPPRVTLEGRAASISAIYEGKTAEQSPFYKPFLSLPASIPSATRAELLAEAKAVIETKVFPAYRDLLPFFRDEYFPRSTTELAATKLPDGEAYYAAQIREFTTLRKSPDEIHQIGLSEVAKIRARMHEVMKEVGFKGDLPAFLAFLRTDPQFYAKTPEELLMRAAWISKKVDGKVKYFFGRLPRSRFDVIPVPDDVAPFYTAGRGGTGVYLVNTYNLPSRALYSLPALTLHESAPGHAFQIPLADEQQDVPEFRRKTYISAFGEGWALYCELLGEEMGIYQTPYEKFGMLSYQMWRAARLVVDTGIHAKGWTREQGQAFLRDNTALAEHEIVTEVDRYISWPGQALSYYLGEMAILDGRRKAEAALKEKFDIRHFHDTVLQLGSVPLPVLEARIDRFIAEGGPDPYKAR